MNSGSSLATKNAPLATSSERTSLGPVGLAFYNALYWPYLLVSCALLFVPALGLFLLTVTWDKRLSLLRRFTGAWGRHYLTAAPLVRIKLERPEALPRSPCIYVANHQSMVDILALFSLGIPFLWVSKRENFYVPFLGWNMALNRYIPLKRGHLPSILAMVRLCQRRLEEGYDLCVFPEGTRSPDGNLRAFHRGAFFLATKYRVPIVPLIVEGTRHILPKRRFRISPEAVSIRVLDPIDPQSTGYDSRRLRDETHRRMLAALEELRRAGATASH